MNHWFRPLDFRLTIFTWIVFQFVYVPMFSVSLVHTIICKCVTPQPTGNIFAEALTIYVLGMSARFLLQAFHVVCDWSSSYMYINMVAIINLARSSHNTHIGTVVGRVVKSRQKFTGTLVRMVRKKLARSLPNYFQKQHCIVYGSNLLVNRQDHFSRGLLSMIVLSWKSPFLMIWLRL